jgi:hypothetical protein
MGAMIERAREELALRYEVTLLAASEAYKIGRNIFFDLEAYDQYLGQNPEVQRLVERAIADGTAAAATEEFRAERSSNLPQRRAPPGELHEEIHIDEAHGTITRTFSGEPRAWMDGFAWRSLCEIISPVDPTPFQRRGNPEQTMVDAWLLARAEKAAPTRLKTIDLPLYAEAKKEIGATSRLIRKAFSNLPEQYRNGRGRPAQ